MADDEDEILPQVLDVGGDSELFGLDLHPTQDMLALGLVDGRALLYSYLEKGAVCALHAETGAHKEACRAVLFEPSLGVQVFTASSDKSIRALDIETGKKDWDVDGAHPDAVNCLTYWGEGRLLVSGDDVGGVKLWDCRQSRKAVVSVHKHEDFIADLLVHEGTLFAASGDNTLSTYDLRQRKLAARTMDQEDELLSLSVLKHGRKVVAGTQSGVLLIYSWGEWLNSSDRFVGHPETVEALVKVDEETLLTGSSDGLIRLCSVLPNRLLGVVGTHDAFPVEGMRLSRDGEVLVSVAHDSCVRFWDLSSGRQ
ncbi:transducin wd-40 repeat-containing protein [Nannochloropsis gaditana]|uniref:Transducin wd-40 repeat-containing protein n=1 Tax=Nannochloropsis gaditana TaxID=72520 RepID=W7TUT1_9STRA|nr:transducin wd-40 repeat-containing protein [Nannochloropsis gaditana]